MTLGLQFYTVNCSKIGFLKRGYTGVKGRYSVAQVEPVDFVAGVRSTGHWQVGRALAYQVGNDELSHSGSFSRNFFGCQQRHGLIYSGMRSLKQTLWEINRVLFCL